MCRLRNIAMRDYQESVTTGQTHRRMDERTDRETNAVQSDPYVPICFTSDTKTFIFVTCCLRYYIIICWLVSKEIVIGGKAWINEIKKYLRLADLFNINLKKIRSKQKLCNFYFSAHIVVILTKKWKIPIITPKYLKSGALCIDWFFKYILQDIIRLYKKYFKIVLDMLAFLS